MASRNEDEGLFQRLMKIDALEFLARVITRAPEPKRHSLLYYGALLERGSRTQVWSADLAVNHIPHRGEQREPLELMQ